MLTTRCFIIKDYKNITMPFYFSIHPSFWSGSWTVCPSRSLGSTSPWRSPWSAAAAWPPWLPPDPPPRHRSWGCPPAGPGRCRWWCTWRRRWSPRSGFCARRSSRSRSSRSPRTPHSRRGHRTRGCSCARHARTPRRRPPILKTPPPSIPWSPGCPLCKGPFGEEGENMIDERSIRLATATSNISYIYITLHLHSKMWALSCSESPYFASYACPTLWNVSQH